jgi:predicted ATPase/class 3 adenylate cyclase/DNA-binding XRE family transcriptional regulator
LAEVSFGEWLKRQRMGRGLTREQLAHEIGCAVVTLRKIEAEERRPSAQIVERLAEILNIPQDQNTAFLRFARGDWNSAPAGVTENFPWLASPAGEREADNVSQPAVHLATFLFTDIEGSAKLWDQAPEKMKVALYRHHAILQAAVTSNGGAVFQIVGDAFCAAFPTVLSAVFAAVTAQQELYQESWGLPFPIRVRMGIHTGEAEQIADSLLLGGYASNQTLNRVARILSAAHGGQILLSLATTDLVKDSLPPNTDLRDMGEHHLKNLIHPEHLFQLNISGLPSEFPPLNTLTHRHNLPIELTSFIGREKEQSEVIDLLVKNRLVTLTGAGGIGKTRLSIEAARAVLTEFPDGVFFVALAPLPMGDSNLIARVVVQALGFVEVGNLPAEKQLVEGIGSKRMLLVLDNCEHLIEGVAVLASDLLSTCPQIKILATSRESLRIPGEWLYAVPTLGVVPEENMPFDLETASKSPMLRLFAERARAVRSDFTLTKDNLKPVTSICMQLDGLPLAIELIAARIRLMPPQALLERLSGQFILTADGMRSTSERQKTLNNTIRWSYSLLSEAEQKLFAYLSVFSGGFTLEAAEEMFSGTFTGNSISNLIASLLDKSLLQRALEREARPGDVGRIANPTYTMLVMIQEFARERLLEMGEATETRDRHLTYFCELAEQARPQLRGAGQLAWLDRLDAEYDNIRAALNWAQESSAIAEGLRLATSLQSFWIWRVHLQETILALENLLAGTVPADLILVFAKGHRLAGTLQWQVGNKTSAVAHAYEDERLCQLLGSESKLDQAIARQRLKFFIHDFPKEPLQVHQWFDEVLKLLQQTGDQWQMATWMSSMGRDLGRSGDFMGARQALEQSLLFFRECGDILGAADSKRFLAGLALQEGNYTEARALAEDTLQFERQARLDFVIDISLWILGVIAMREEDYVRAKELYTECLLFDQKIGLPRQLAECLIGFAGIANAERHLERAAQLLGAGEAEVEARVDPLENIDRIEVERLTAVLRKELGDAKFEALAMKGRAMTREQAITFALETSP